MLHLPALLLLLAQDDPVELKWAAEKEDKFEIKWTYDDVNVRVPGQGDKTEVVDKRTVEAEMTPKEEPGQFAVTLKKVSWTFSTNEFEIVLNWAAGPKAPECAPKMKIGPKASNFENAKSFGSQRADQMKKLVGEGTYVLQYDSGRGEAYIMRNGSAARQQSIFDVAFLHSPLPKGTVTNGQTWKEGLESVAMPQLVEVKTMGCKVAYAGPAVKVSGGFTQPISRAGGQKGESTTGSFTFAREFVFAKEGCLLSAKEDRLYSKKIDAKGNDADFYKENSSQNIKQVITFKKKAAAKPADPKPAEK